MSMHTVSDIEAWLDSGDRAANPADHARELLQAGEEVLTNWIIANGGEPENTTRPDFPRMPARSHRSITPRDRPSIHRIAS